MIRTKVKPSSIPGAGLGLFADQEINKGDVVWTFCPGYDIILTQDDLLRMSEASRWNFLNYCYFDKHTKRFVLCGDDDRFINHSKKNANLVQKQEQNGKDEGVVVASRDIRKGEELLCDYYEYDLDADRKLNRTDMYAYLDYEERQTVMMRVKDGFRDIKNIIKSIFVSNKKKNKFD